MLQLWKVTHFNQKLTLIVSWKSMGCINTEVASKQPLMSETSNWLEVTLPRGFAFDSINIDIELMALIYENMNTICSKLGELMNQCAGI